MSIQGVGRRFFHVLSPFRHPLDDLALIEGLRSRREAAVTTFLERYKSLLYHCIGHFESDAVAREDRYQDIVLFVLERLDRDAFDPDRGSFGTWLYRVAWCRCVDLKRKDNAGREPWSVGDGRHLRGRRGREGRPRRALHRGAVAP